MPHKTNHFIKRLISLTISFLFLLQTTLHAYTPQQILLQSVTGKVNNLQVQSASVVLESLNNISHHETTKTTNGALTTTTTMQGSNVETIAGTNIIVGGTFSINGDDLTNELYDGVLTSQATREDPAKAQQAITQALNAGIQNYLESANTQEDSTTPYSGYSSTAISTIQTTAVSEHWDESADISIKFYQTSAILETNIRKGLSCQKNQNIHHNLPTYICTQSTLYLMVQTR